MALAGCSSTSHFSFLNPQGPIAAAESTHFYWVLGILGVFVALPIFLLVPWLMWRYRYNAKKSLYTPRWKAYLPLEIMTWLGPLVIVIVLGVLIWRNAHKLDPYAPVAGHGDVVHVQVVGYNWKWLFIYPQQHVASIGVLAIPVDHPIAMKLTSATVMQSLQIPALVGQIYAMGGMITQLHFKADHAGRFLGENTMYNGDGFHRQKFVTHAMPQPAFEAWLKNIRHNGISLDSKVHHKLLEYNTRAQLASELRRPDKGSIYFNRVRPGFFRAVVKATMKGDVQAPKQITALAPTQRVAVGSDVSGASGNSP